MGPHEEIGWDMPIGGDFLNHLQSEGTTAGKDFGCPRARAEDLGKLGLGVAQLVDRVAQHIDLDALDRRKPQDRGRRFRIGSRQELPADGRGDY